MAVMDERIDGVRATVYRTAELSTMTLKRVAGRGRQPTNGGREWKRAASVTKSREKTEKIDEEERFES